MKKFFIFKMEGALILRYTSLRSALRMSALTVFLYLIPNVSYAGEPSLLLDAFLYQICISSRTHTTNQKTTQEAARFYLSVKQACSLLENIIAGFKDGTFNTIPQIKEGFYAINSSFGGYPKITKINQQKLTAIREQITIYQAFLTQYKLQNQLQFSEQETSFMLLLQRFNEFLIANILHEQYLPYMEEYETWWQKIENSPVALPALYGLTGFASWIAATAVNKSKSNEKLNKDDVITGLSVGTLFGLLGYIAMSYRNRA